MDICRVSAAQTVGLDLGLWVKVAFKDPGRPLGAVSAW